MTLSKGGLVEGELRGVESEVAGVGKMQQEAEAASRVAKSAAGTRGVCGVGGKGPRSRPRGGADGLMTPQTAARF